MNSPPTLTSTESFSWGPGVIVMLSFPNLFLRYFSSLMQLHVHIEKRDPDQIVRKHRVLYKRYKAFDPKPPFKAAGFL